MNDKEGFAQVKTSNALELAELCLAIVENKPQDEAIVDIEKLLIQIRAYHFRYGLEAALGFEHIPDNRKMTEKLAYYLWQIGFSEDADKNWFEAERILE